MRYYFNRYLNRLRAKITLLIILVLFALTYYIITRKINFADFNPKSLVRVILIALILFLILASLLAKKIFWPVFGSKDEHSYLQTRIIIAFSLVSTIPTIIVAAFAAYIFNFSIQAWFNQKIVTILDESIIVAKAHIEDHTIQLRTAALSIASDLSFMYYKFINDPEALTEALNNQASIRGLDEAIIFQSSTKSILAQTPLSFSLSFATILPNAIEKADQGQVVQIHSSSTKIRMLIKLPEYKDTYLLIGKLIDQKIIDHIDTINGAATEYYRVRNDITSIQVKFFIMFIVVALLLLYAAIGWGVTIARQIVKPIKKLVIAAKRAKEGDLTVQVDEEELHKDEIMILTQGFNRMIRQINRQHKDLVVAQRALAWSDVARRVAHEIKNPLTPIQLASERLLTKFTHEVTDEHSFRKYVTTILNHAQDIEKIVTEFVNFARLPLPEFCLCEIVSLIKEIVEARKLINDKITYIFSANKPTIEFIGDPTQINQIIINLIKNSEEALEEIKDNKIIEVLVTQETDEVIIFIRDNGPGFPEYLISKATEAYITNRPKGMGLGLAIVKKIVQDHLGTIEIYNLDPCGSEIKLTFNLTELLSKLNKT